MTSTIWRRATTYRVIDGLWILVLAGIVACGPVAAPDTPGDTVGADSGLTPVTDQNLADLVDPFIGSAGRGGWWAGNVFVGATTPFGMVQVGPDTSAPDDLVPWAWNHCSGYHAEDTHLDAFSHTHLHGTGITHAGRQPENTPCCCKEPHFDLANANF